MSASSSASDSAPLPCFEDWVDRKIRPREDYVVLRTNVLYYGTMVNLTFIRENLITLSNEHNGMRPVDSEEFKIAQKHWWYYYRKMTILRAFVLQYFDIPPPNWADEIMPERNYCRVLLSQEDFKEFITAKGSGMTTLEPDSEKKYADELRENRTKEKSGPVPELKEKDEKEEAEEEKEDN